MFFFNNRQTPENNLENLYPDIYKDLYPYATDAANALMKQDNYPNDELLNNAIDNILKNTYLWDEDEESIVQPIYAQPRFNRLRRRYHNRNTLRDILRILILRELFSRQ